MSLLTEKLQSNPVIYVTRDIERALGLNPDTEGYFIISNSTDFAKQIAKNRQNILLISDGAPLDTSDLLQRQETEIFINKIENASVVVFKNTKQIENICAAKKWPLLNPSAEVSNQIEEKISQVKLFSCLNDLFLKYQILACKDVQWNGKKFILQFNHSHTGSGTVLIDSEQKLKELQKTFPNRETRISDFVEGPMFTNNNVLSGDTLLIGNISYQITGLAPFTERAFSTIGNDWGLAKKLMTPTHLEYYKLIVKSAAEELKKIGWKGLFGMDAIMDEKTGKIYLVEINARQPASTTYETMLQKSQKKQSGLSTFEAHLAALFGLDLSLEHITEIDNGSQIIQRILNAPKIQCPLVNIVADLKREGFNVVRYDNNYSNIGAELLRIQSQSSVMEKHNQFNTLGEKIINIILANKKTLSDNALKVIDEYFHLPAGDKTVACPYFNNARAKVRGGLHVFIGKGSPYDIFEEINILEKKKKLDLNKLGEQDLKKFLVENDLGIDCSGFVYHVLNAETQAREKGKLKKSLSFPFAKNFLHKILMKLRAAQSTSVLVLTHPDNSLSVKLREVKPGDMIIMLDAGSKNDRNHILLIESVEQDGSDCNIETEKSVLPTVINYVHSFAWSSDGKYNNGVKMGKIEITNIDGGLLQQKWIESGKIDKENETYLHAKQAKILDIRRLNVLG